MSQRRNEHLVSAAIGIFLGALGFLACGAVATGMVIANAAGALASSAPGIFSISLLSGAGVVGAASAIGAILRGAEGSFRPLTAFVGGIATMAAGLAFFFGLSPEAWRAVRLSESSPRPEPVEDTRGTAFASYKNAFNAETQADEKTLVLTARDFASVPANRL